MNRTKYNIKIFKKDLKEFLLKSSSKPYDRQGEGLVHFVDIINKKNLPKKNQADFLVLLSLFIMIDLIFYTYFQKYYLKLKRELKTPKFEYGLTNTFMGPEVPLIRARSGIHVDFIWKSFQKMVPIFDDELNIFLDKINLDKKKVEKTVFQDKDIVNGLFGIMLVKAYGKKMDDFFAEDENKEFGNIKIWKNKNTKI